MVILTIPPWSVSGTMSQRSTRWELSDDQEGKIVIKNTVTTGTDMFMLKDIGTYPDKKIIYVRPVRVFDSSEIPLERVAVPLTSHLCNNVIYRDGANVREPLVYINEDEYNDKTSPDFTIYTSEFFATQDYHLSSNWILSDSDGNIIMSFLRNKFNKTSIRIPKSKVTSFSYLNIKVQHVTNTGLESSFGVLEIYRNTGEQFQVVRNIDNVNPDEDLNVYLSPSTVFSNGNIVSLFLRTLGATDGELNTVTIQVPSSNPIVIPNRYLKNDSTYYLDIFSNDSGGNLIKSTVTINTRITENIPAKSVSGTLEKIGDFTNLNLPLGFCTNDYVFGNNLLPLSGETSIKVNTLRQYTGINGVSFRLTVGYSTRNDISLPSQNNDSLFIRYINGILIVDSFNSQTKPMFQVYKYNSTLDEFTLLHTLSRNELIPIGYNSNAFIHNDRLYYKVSSSKEIKIYDYYNNTLETFIELTDDMIDSSIIFNPVYEKILITNRDSFFRVLDIKTKDIVTGDVISFGVNSGERLKVFQLKNGDSFLVNLSLSNEITELLHYRAEDSMIVDINTDIINYTKHAGIINSDYNSVFILQNENDHSNKQELYRFY